MMCPTAERPCLGRAEAVLYGIPYGVAGGKEMNDEMTGQKTHQNGPAEALRSKRS
jgi:hypothetical protein